MAPLLAHKPGVDRAFERLYRRHALDVYRYAYGVLRNQADAEDVTQTTFMNAYRALERGESPESPQNWLIAIAHNVCRQRWRQASRRVQEVGLDVDVADTLVGPDDDSAPEPEDIKRALGHLAFNQRAALVMRELEGRSYAEIADLLDLSVSAVETLIFRARRALREQLEGALTCGEAEQLLSLQLDGRIDRSQRSQLRAHLRECAECRKLARRQRAQRSALRSLGAVPLPSSLASLFGGGGAAVAAKVATVVVVAGAAGGIGYQADQMLTPAKPKPAVHHVRHVKHSIVPIAAVSLPVHHRAEPHATQVVVRHAAAPPAKHAAQPRPAVVPAPTPTTTRPDDAAIPPATTPAAPEHPTVGRGNGGTPPGPERKPDTPPGQSGEQHGKSGEPHGNADGGAPVTVPAPPVDTPPVHVPPGHEPPVETPTVPAVTVPAPPVTVPGLGH